MSPDETQLNSLIVLTQMCSAYSQNKQHRQLVNVETQTKLINRENVEKKMTRFLECITISPEISKNSQNVA